MMHSDNPKIQTLLKLGEPETNYRSCPDYVGRYGFTLDDVPSLLMLYSDDEINSLDSHRAEVWAPLYAWRILGQLRSEQAIQPIIASFDTLFDDDCAQSELGIALGLIGPKAIEPLERYLQQADKDRDEFSYALASESLCEIAKAHPDSRAQVMQVYRDYMANPIESMHALNGLLVGDLMELDATEAIDDIRRLFARGCVDISCAGDLEDVEIELGFRDERTTPAPNFAECFNFDNVLPPLQEEEHSVYSNIESWLAELGSVESIGDFPGLEGYFAAITCSPEKIMPSTWMPAIWGGEACAPAWQNKKDIDQFTRAVFELYNIVLDELQDGDYVPVFLQDNEEDCRFRANEWCKCFVRGLTLWEEMPAENMRQIENCLQPVRYFCTDEGEQYLSKMKDAEIIQLQKSIKPNVLKLYRHFHQSAKTVATTLVHSTPKVGRNEPCPCGSGKKYKKCCGLN